MPVGSPGPETCHGSLILTLNGVFLQGSFLPTTTGPPRASLPWRGFTCCPPACGHGSLAEPLQDWGPCASLGCQALPAPVTNNCPLPTKTHCQLPSSQSCFTWSVTGLLKN